ncbi:hypothetical protein HYH03_004282 [Edaphochlamys debaryana]|uniref:Uncharacterized protein n=1 Tax=Edaphochlamys debaryana TaxID=47281 RepID=A0A836C3T4_9CHLO|nr:hypothetical protein HYH03_004282 [Edaphochlamys debaryana]|eukprot:KAG2498024.1 hypothetical protein HYH03_004282 [Edaphochlamys debaryana]
MADNHVEGADLNAADTEDNTPRLDDDDIHIDDLTSLIVSSSPGLAGTSRSPSPGAVGTPESSQAAARGSVEPKQLLPSLEATQGDDTTSSSPLPQLASAASACAASISAGVRAASGAGDGAGGPGDGGASGADDAGAAIGGAGAVGGADGAQEPMALSRRQLLCDLLSQSGGIWRKEGLVLSAFAGFGGAQAATKAAAGHASETGPYGGSVLMGAGSSSSSLDLDELVEETDGMTAEDRARYQKWKGLVVNAHEARDRGSRVPFPPLPDGLAWLRVPHGGGSAGEAYLLHSVLAEHTTQRFQSLQPPGPPEYSPSWHCCGVKQNGPSDGPGSGPSGPRSSGPNRSTSDSFEVSVCDLALEAAFNAFKDEEHATSDTQQGDFPLGFGHGCNGGSVTASGCGRDEFSTGVISPPDLDPAVVEVYTPAACCSDASKEVVRCRRGVRRAAGVLPQGSPAPYEWPVPELPSRLRLVGSVPSKEPPAPYGLPPTAEYCGTATRVVRGGYVRFGKTTMENAFPAASSTDCGGEIKSTKVIVSTCLNGAAPIRHENFNLVAYPTGKTKVQWRIPTLTTRLTELDPQAGGGQSEVVHIWRSTEHAEQLDHTDHIFVAMATTG